LSICEKKRISRKGEEITNVREREAREREARDLSPM